MRWSRSITTPSDGRNSLATALALLRCDDSKVVIHAVDGTAIEGSGNSPFDIATLAAATGAPNVQLNIAVGVTSSRRRGEPASHEILITLAGETAAGQ